MALDIEKLVGAHRFSLLTDKLGKLLVHGLSSFALSSLKKGFVTFIDADSSAFVKKLTTLVCQQDANESGNYTEDRITEEQAELLSEDELEQFSEKFVEKNRYLREKSKTEKIKNEDGEQIIVINRELRSDLEKNNSESWQSYLKRLMHHYQLDQEEQTRKLFEKLNPKRLFSDPLVSLINQNRNISEQLGRSIDIHGSIKIPELTENPVYETNRQLEAIGSEFREASRLVKNMNDLGLQMAIEMAEGARTTKRHNTIMIAIGLVTLIFTAIMSFLSYVSSKKSSRDIEGLLSNSIKIQEAAIKSNKEDHDLRSNELSNVQRALIKIETNQKSIAARVEQLNSKVVDISKATDDQIIESPQ